MKFQTLRFGEIDVDESLVIQMKGGILGFEHLQHYFLLIQDQKNPLWWLQSREDGAVAFVVVDPAAIKPDYHPVIQKTDKDFLEIVREEDLSILAIVTIRSQPFRVTANLRAPLIINTAKRLGSQIVLEDAEYPIRYPICSAETTEERMSTAGAGCI